MMSPWNALSGGAKIRQLLAAAGSTEVHDAAGPPAEPYDWRDPHWLDTVQFNRLGQVMAQTATGLAEILARARGRPFDGAVKAITQHFAGDLFHHLDLERSHCLTFAPDKGAPCGFVSISAQTASTWVTWLLGDAEATHDPDRALSTLEESLLSDLVIALLEVFLAPVRPHQNLKPVPPLSQGQPSLQFELTEEVCRVIFAVKSAEGGEAYEIVFLLPCSRLAALVGKTPAVAPQTSPQALSQALREHLHGMPVTVRAVLASATLKFRDILDLGPGDILLLDLPVDGPAQLVIDGRTMYRGRPARSQGQYAVVVTEAQTTTIPQPRTTKATQRT